MTVDARSRSSAASRHRAGSRPARLARPSVPAARPAALDAVGRRGAAAQAGARAGGRPREALFVLDEPSAGLHADEVERLCAGAAPHRRRRRQRDRGRARSRSGARRRLGDRLGPAPARTAAGRRRGHAGRGRSRRDSHRAIALAPSPARLKPAKRQPKSGTAPTAPARARRSPRARAQPEGGLGRDPARQADGRDRAERLRQEHAGVRRGLRRGPAALPGDADALRAAVPADHAAPRRGLGHRGPAVDRARAAHRARRRQVHRRHRHRGRALPAPALRKVGEPHCPTHERPIASRARDELFDSVRKLRGRMHCSRRRSRAQGHLPRRLHGGRARRHRRPSPTARWSRPSRRRSSRRPRSTRSISDRRAARDERCTPRAARARPRARARRAQAARRKPARRRCSRPAPARAAASPCPSSIRAGSPSTPSRAAASAARAPACWSRKGGRTRQATPVEEQSRECPECEGARLSRVPRAVRLAGERYHELVGRSVVAALAQVRKLAFTGDAARIAEPCSRSSCAASTSSRGRPRLPGAGSPRATLSGGEMQRLRLAAQLGAGSPARSTCSTSRRSACTRATRGACSPTCGAGRPGLHGARRRARRRHHPRRRSPDRSRARAAARAAATSSPRARPRRCWRPGFADGPRALATAELARAAADRRLAAVPGAQGATAHNLKTSTCRSRSGA